VPIAALQANSSSAKDSWRDIGDFRSRKAGLRFQRRQAECGMNAALVSREAETSKRHVRDVRTWRCDFNKEKCSAALVRGQVERPGGFCRGRVVHGRGGWRHVVKDGLAAVAARRSGASLRRRTTLRRFREFVVASA
jgi:hypothetical protein